jgi:hypothetical protein
MSATKDSKPLAGVKVLDMAAFLAAPMASMYLADFGADVLKIERPGEGDEVRKWGKTKHGVGLYYKVINRGKRSITVDLRTPFGVETVKRLVKDVDVIVENYRPGTIEKWGLGYDVLSAINPRLIMLLGLRPDWPLQLASGVRHARRGLFGLRAHLGVPRSAAAAARLRPRRFDDRPDGRIPRLGRPA